MCFTIEYAEVNGKDRNNGCVKGDPWNGAMQQLSALHRVTYVEQDFDIQLLSAIGEI